MKHFAIRVALACACVCASACAAPVLPALFTDHMMLQRDRAVPVWGWADPGESITVTLDGKSATGTADSNGRWRVELPAHPAGGPYTLRIAGKRSVEIRDVLVGEVWVASGQSNMTFPLGNTTTAAQDVPAASNPNIRLFTVPKATSLVALDRIQSSWQVCTPESARPFSAVAYYFARTLQQRLGVPVGIIHSGWPGTQGEEWTDPASMRAHPELKPILEQWDAAPEKAGTVQQPGDVDLTVDSLELVRRDGANPLSLSWSFAWSSAPEVSFEKTAHGARLSGKLRASESAPLRGELTAGGTPLDLSRDSALRFRVRGKGVFRVYVIQPSITDSDNYGSGPIDAKSDWTTVTIPFADLHQAGWGKKQPFTPQAIEAVVIEPLLGRDTMRPPSGLYNAMIAPIAGHGMRGAIWYQGEGNAGRAHQYRTLLRAMIQGWRRAWGEGDFPFLIVQLPNYRGRRPEPSESDWAELREAQLRTLGVPNTGLAVTIDLGEADDVHPRDKRFVGARLARWALGPVYGVEQVYSGPLYESMQVDGSRVKIRFRNTGAGLVALDNMPLRGFAVAGEDRRFVWADAIIEGDTVVVSSPQVAKPVAVRYAWADNPDCNLGNVERLPASPFRTDEWPRMESNN